MMKTLAAVLVAAGVLAGCSDSPQNYACGYVDQSKTILSLSIKPDSAILDKLEYTKFCKKEGNSVLYGVKPSDCDGLSTNKDYAVLRFDSIIGRADTYIHAGTSIFSESFKCTKVN